MSTELKKRKLLLRDFQNGISVSEATLNLEEKFGKRGFGVRTVQKWYKKFRGGDFNLDEKPKTGYQSRKATLNEIDPPKAKTIAEPKQTLPKEVEVDVSQEEQKKESPKVKENGSQLTFLQNDAVQKWMQRKSEITVSRVKRSVDLKKDATEENIITKKSITPVMKITKVSSGSITPVKGTAKVRTANGLKADLMLSPNIAKQMATLKSSTESHSIGEWRKSSRTSGEALKKFVTVEFQNISPAIVKNTMRKSSETTATPLNANKRLLVPQSTPLSSPKGVIYLNPQEIFKHSLEQNKALNRSAPSSGAFPRAVRNLPKIPVPLQEKVTGTAQTIQVDSDSEDDIVFPEDISLPQPKIKFVTETFTTYWDMETDKPILLNPTDENTVPSSTVIEID